MRNLRASTAGKTKTPLTHIGDAGHPVVGGGRFSVQHLNTLNSCHTAALTATGGTTGGIFPDRFQDPYRNETATQLGGCFCR